MNSGKQKTTKVTAIFNQTIGRERYGVQIVNVILEDGFVFVCWVSKNFANNSRIAIKRLGLDK